MHRTKLAIVGAVMGVFAAVALGQNADKNTAPPTRNDYKLGIVEPTDGATINGPSVRVVVNTQVREQLGDPENPRRDVNSMPRPDVDVFLDGTLRGTMHDQNNVLQLDDVTPGPHKLTFLAKNLSNEIIDRAEIHFSNVASESVATNTTTSSVNTTSSSSASSSTTSNPPPQPAYSAPPAPPASTYSPPPPSTYSSSSASRLPATASNDGALAIGGVALLLAALWLRRASRNA
ncbi:MAG TPA: LPXTG cell wall anchor domain-containing protein [Thermoanaerobaculia bacterium]|nr:LPXTG cell wall anchor domain-containing protein [Thermoanaerobaculia bacterium]